MDNNQMNMNQNNGQENMNNQYQNPNMNGQYQNPNMNGQYQNPNMNGQYQNSNLNGQYQNQNMNGQYQNPNMNGQYQNQNMNGPRGLVPETNVILAFILSIVTCGIYGIYWFAKMTDESNSISDLQTASGVLAILYTLISCGIYSFYWNYQMGKKLFIAGQKYGVYIEDRSILYLILGIFGFSWLVWIFVQEDLNKFA